MALFKEPKNNLILYGSAPMADGSHPVYMRVNYKGKRKYFATGISGISKQWNSEKERFKPCRPKCKNNECDSCQCNAALDGFMSEYHNVIFALRKLYPEFNLREFCRLLTGDFDAPAGSVLSVFEMKIAELKEGLKDGSAGVGTRDVYINTRNNFELFLESKGFERDLGFSAIDYDFLKAFERYLKSSDRKVYVWMRKENKYVKRSAQKGLSSTSLSIAMRNLRTVWNLAKKKKLTHGLDYPFDSYSIKSGTPNKDNYRHLTTNEINKLIAYQSQIKNREKHESLLLWLAMFYSHGANMADLCRLKWEENVKPLGAGSFHVWYRRTKTRGREKQPEANIVGDPNLDAIISYFAEKPNPSPFVIPVLLHAWVRNKGKLTEEQISNAYKTRNKLIVRHMRELCKQVGIERPEQVDCYTARHSWASNEYKCTKDIFLVSKKLLHTNVVTTQRYLESLGEVVHLQASKASEEAPFTLMQIAN